MEAKNLTIEQCETFEDELTQKAVEYANLIKTPNQRALAAKDVITGLPEKDITLAYKDGYRAQLDQISTEMAQQLVNLRRDCKEQTGEYASKAAKDITSVKESIAGLERRVESLDARTGSCAVTTKDIRQKFYDHSKEVSAESRNHAERMRQNERDVGELHERKASKVSVWFLAAATLLQSGYIGFELSRNPDTYVSKAYHAVKSWVNQ